jgi:hypothetical protein
VGTVSVRSPGVPGFRDAGLTNAVAIHLHQPE